METVINFIFLGSKIIMDGDCSHEIKRCLLLERKAVTNLDGILKSNPLPPSDKRENTRLFRGKTLSLEDEIGWGIAKLSRN